MMSARVKWIIALTFVFALLISTNIADRYSFRQMNYSVVGIYEDRLLAKGMVYDMRSIVADKQVALAQQDAAYWQGSYEADTAELLALMEAFSRTELSPHERSEYHSLQDSYARLAALERTAATSTDGPDPAVLTELQQTHDAVVADLFSLSRIQLSEGERKHDIASRALRSVDLLTKIEIGLLVLLGLAVAVLLFYWPRTDDD